MSKKIKKIRKSEKITFFSKKSQNLKIFFHLLKEKKEKNAILLVLLFEEISLRLELSRPPHLELLMDSPRTWRAAGGGAGQARFLIGWVNMNYGWIWIMGELLLDSPQTWRAGGWAGQARFLIGLLVVLYYTADGSLLYYC